MTKAAFWNHLKQVYGYYNESRPDKDTMASWFHELERLPDEFLDWAFTWMKKNVESPPFRKNYPRFVFSVWGRWLQENPEKREFRSCSDPWCDGEGLIHSVKEGEGGTFPVYCFRCGTCQQSRMPAFTTTSKELRLAGYNLDCTDETNKRLAAQPKVERGRIRGNVGEITKTWGETEWENWSSQQRS